MKTKAKTPTASEVDFVWSIFVTALESGIHGVAIWANIKEYRHHEEDKYKARAVIVDHDDGKRHVITLHTIRRGLDAIDKSDWKKDADLGMHRSYRATAHIARLALDASDIDGPMADLIVQCGLFGEVRYS